MMAVWASSGALLLVLLAGASYAYPAKMGFDPSSSSSSYGVNPAPTGSGWKVPYSGGYVPSGSGTASKTVSNPAPPQPAPRKEPRYSEPSVHRAEQPSAYPYAAPENPGDSSSPSAGAAQPSTFQPASTPEITWAVAPPSPFSGEETSRRPSTYRFASSNSAPEPLGPSNVSPPVFPEFQAGELSHSENTYEHGNYESETEELGFQPPPGAYAVTGPKSTSEMLISEPRPSGMGRGWVTYPYPYDYMFLTGQYPPGTVTHFSNSFEQGRDYWQDTHYIRDHFPANPTTQEVETFPTAPEARQSIRQPSQPVKQTTGSTGHGWSGGQNQPYGGVGLPGPYSQPGGYRRHEAHIKQ